ncbi:hypothetical protein ACFFSH_39345 [Streptomyces filamentosus]|uniref:Uncharacterized protein n=1 Tax=Streptomyces filamentosus TaxID=67294 RepID=A0A919EQE3_STRFL|nr:hypothetical protein [Streptomyces filamentosus]GHG15343.1 hypothetical protein GCM10017667_56110 [Streptomyces filamentosus]
MTQPSPTVGSVWLSRYTTGLRVTVTETTGTRIRIADIDPTTGQPRPGGRWTTTSQLTRAYTPETP